MVKYFSGLTKPSIATVRIAAKSRLLLPCQYSGFIPIHNMHSYFSTIMSSYRMGRHDIIGKIK